MIEEIISKAQFRHPGIGCTKETLDICRNMVLKNMAPWVDYFEGLLNTSYAALNIKPKLIAQICNNSDIADFATDAQMLWAQCVIYAVTQNDAYLKVPQKILEHYSAVKSFFPKYFTDSHIKIGKYVYTMCAGADIMRGAHLDYTKGLYRNCIKPICDKSLHFNGYFMNQHTYAIIGCLAAAIMADDRDAYNEIVEWTTVNKSAPNQARNGAIDLQMRMVINNEKTGESVPETFVLVEMGRDQDHAEGNVTNLLQMTRTMELQGTLVNEAGEASESGVSPVHFKNDKIFSGARAYLRYNLGYSVPWVPTYAECEGDFKIIYSSVSLQDRGRIITNGVAASYYYYKSINMCDKYITMAYCGFRALHDERARRGEFIETLHNYAFDFWIGLNEEAAEERASGEVCRVRDVSTPWGESSILLHSKCAKRALWVEGDAKMELYDINMRLCDTVYTRGAGAFYEFSFTSGELYIMKIEGKAEFGNISDDYAKVPDLVPRTLIAQPESAKAGEYIRYVEKRVRKSARVTVQTYYVPKDKSDALRYALQGVGESALYEDTSALEAAKKSGDAMRVLRAAKALRLLNPRLCDASLDYSAICIADCENIEKLCDGSTYTFISDFRQERFITLDFGENYAFCAKSFSITARDGFPDRVDGCAFYASHDAKRWLRITPFAISSPDEQHLEAQNSVAHRYIRVKMRSARHRAVCMDIGEMRLWGERIKKHK